MKKLYATVLAIAMLIGCCSFSASAASLENESSASTNVLYLLSGQYAVKIPGTFTISPTDTATITADYMQLMPNESVVVCLSETSFTGENEYFQLISDEDGRGLLCNLFASENDGEPVEITRANAPYRLVTFTSNNVTDAKANVTVLPMIDRSLSAGVYRGTLYFDISLVDNSQE